MPQLNPMNWLLLMVFFLVINLLLVIKISFFVKELPAQTAALRKSDSRSYTLLKI